MSETAARKLPIVEGAAFSGTHVPLIERYHERLPFSAGDTLVSLQEGSTPLLRAPLISEMVGATVRLKLEGANPTGSFKDRGMTCAVSAAVNWFSCGEYPSSDRFLMRLTEATTCGFA